MNRGLVMGILFPVTEPDVKVCVMDCPADNLHESPGDQNLRHESQFASLFPVRRCQNTMSQTFALPSNAFPE